MEETAVANGCPSHLLKAGLLEEELQARPWPRPHTVTTKLHIPPRSAVSLPWPPESEVTGRPTCISSSSEEAGPEAQRHSHSANRLPRGEGGAESEPQAPPRGGAMRPRTLSLKGPALTQVGGGAVGGAAGGAVGGAVEKDVGGAGGGAVEKAVGGADGQQRVRLRWGRWGGLLRSDSLESLLSRCALQDRGALGGLGGLWRADSWETVCSDPPKHSWDTQNPGEAERGAVYPSDRDWDLGLFEHSHCTHIPQGSSLPVGDELLSPRLEQAKLLLERARMKTRSGPVQATHALSPENTLLHVHKPSVPSVPKWEGPAGLCGYLSDSSSGSSGASSRRRCGLSPTRVRFQDESELEAERRYLDRQRHRLQRCCRDNGSGPSCRKRRSLQGEGPVRSRGCRSSEPPRPRPHRACNSTSVAEADLGPWGAGLPLWAGHSAGGGGVGGVTRPDRPSEQEDSALQLCPGDHAPLGLQPIRTPPLTRHGRWPSPQKATGLRNTDGGFWGDPGDAGGESESWRGEGLWMRSQWEEPCEHTLGSEPHRAVLEGRDPNQPRPKLSLRRFFSAIGLNGTSWLRPHRASSVERLSSAHRDGPSPQGQSPAPSPTQVHRTPSLQTLGPRPPLIVLRRTSSAQDLPLQIKEELASLYHQGAPCNSPSHRGLQQALSVEDVGCPGSAWAPGRLSGVCSDGTILLELRRPHSGPFGFLICRANSRPDSGVYVERVQDGGWQYAGLLGEGDEILEVNGQRVAGLGLDLVSRLMTEHSTALLRVQRGPRSSARQPQPGHPGNKDSM